MFFKSAVAVVALAAFVWWKMPPRVDIPAHLLGHAIMARPGMITPEVGKKLNDLMKEMADFPSNLNADTKTGFAGSREDIGEAEPISADGSCTNKLLVPNGAGTSCVLPQRVDVGKHFMTTGGPSASRENIDDMTARLSSFGRYMPDCLENYPIMKELFADEKFLAAAKAICPANQQVLDPFQFNFIIQVPGQTVALHLDAPVFWGATRRTVPQWLLTAMLFSGLFQERFVNQVQAVGYLHSWSPSRLPPGHSGDFIYYDVNDDGMKHPKGLVAQPLTGNLVDGSKTVHAAHIYRPKDKAPKVKKDRNPTLSYMGNEEWRLHQDIDGNIANYTSDDLRISLVYRARCFTSEEAKAHFNNLPPSEELSVEDILQILQNDMERRGILAPEKRARISKFNLAMLIMSVYIKYPYPAVESAWFPVNYCALPLIAPWTAPIINWICE